jgi:hypothetical protein
MRGSRTGRPGSRGGKGEGKDERIEVAHVDTRREALVRELLAGALESISRVVAQELKLGRQFRWIPTVSQASSRFLTKLDPQLVELLHRLEVRSLIVVALRVGRRPFGAMALARTTAVVGR